VLLHLLAAWPIVLVHRDYDHRVPSIVSCMDASMCHHLDMARHGMDAKNHNNLQKQTENHCIDIDIEILKLGWINKKAITAIVNAFSKLLNCTPTIYRQKQ
jgi:hydroxymethylpyrimidine/phosphomethylpyrimidine kinase